MLNELGAGGAIFAEDQAPLEVVPTGILALDVALGVGGYPRGHIVGAYGARDIGKSSILGLSGVRSAQALGLNAAWISVEHKFDRDWARQLGVDTERLLVAFPDNGEQAFDTLWRVCKSGAVGFVVFDSIGAILQQNEIESGQTNMARSKLISFGVHRILGEIRRNKVAVLLLNQQRHIFTTHGPGGMKQAGPEALEHNEVVIMQVKNGEKSETRKVTRDGQDITYSQGVCIEVKRSQISRGKGQKAFVTFYSDVPEGMDHEVGIDRALDVINTGKRLGVIEAAGRWLTVEGLDQKFGSKADFKAYLDQHPSEVERIRNLVLAKM